MNVSRTTRRSTKRKSSASSRSKTPWRGKTSRRSYTGPTKAIASSSVGLGQSARTVLTTTAIIKPVAGTSGVIKFVLNPGSCYNPLGDAVGLITPGGQPNLFDQWAATYQRYVVEKAYVKLEVSTQGFNAGGVNTATLFAAFPSINSAPLAGNYIHYAAQPNAKSVLLGPTDTTTTNTLVFRLDHAKVLGKKGAVTSEDNGASVTQSPPAGQYMSLPCVCENSSAAIYNWVIRCTMYQTVYFDKRINVQDVGP